LRNAAQRRSWTFYETVNIHNRKSFEWFLSFHPFLNEPVNFFSVNYTEDENTVTGNFENNTVISDSQLPVSFKGSLQRFSMAMVVRRQRSEVAPAK
jgi:hypothetical protein